MIELVSKNQLGIVDYSIVLQLNNSASDSVCLNEFHVVIVTSYILNLVCLHTLATLSGNTPSKQMVKWNVL